MQIVFVIVFLFCGTAFGQKASGINGLAVLAGCWERNENNSVYTEQWMKPAGDAMVGATRTVKNGKLSNWEFMRVETRADGIYFIAQPRENPAETAFKLIKSTAGEFVFENPQHDFPQRVIYKISGNALTGRIEGKNNGKPIAIDFPMRRISCV